MLMSLGEFVFERGTLAPNTFSRSITANWQKLNRYQRRPSIQFTGITGETATIPGVIYPRSGITGDSEDLRQIEDMLTAGGEYVLVSGDGYVHGLFAILSLNETRSLLDGQGRPSKIEFEIQIERTDDERTERLDIIAT